MKRRKRKEFNLDSDDTYLILKFPDWSILVLRKTEGEKGASPEYESIEVQKEILRKLSCGEDTTYRMGASLFK
jgi:hypothetical protein